MDCFDLSWKYKVLCCYFVSPLVSFIVKNKNTVASAQLIPNSQKVPAVCKLLLIKLFMNRAMISTPRKIAMTTSPNCFSLQTSPVYIQVAEPVVQLYVITKENIDKSIMLEISR